MTTTPDTDSSLELGEVLCHTHPADVDLLCMRCLARLHVDNDTTVLATVGENFLHEHTHSTPAPTHPWSTPPLPPRLQVAAVCNGSRRQLAAARATIETARAAGWSVRVVHPLAPRWVTTMGEAATTLDADRHRHGLEEATADLVAHAGSDVALDVVDSSGLALLTDLVDRGGVDAVVLPQRWLPARWVRWFVDRRTRRVGRPSAPQVVVLHAPNRWQRELTRLASAASAGDGDRHCAL